MKDITQFTFRESTSPTRVQNLPSLPLVIEEEPKDFYAMKTDPLTMTYLQLKKFIADQTRNGVNTAALKADLYSKFAFPFVIFISSLVVLPFALSPARSGKMAFGFMAGLFIGFSYYAVHSLSLAMGRAELWPPLLAAWMANILLGTIGLHIKLGR